MADNIYVDPGVGAGKVLVATDDVTGVHYPVVKLDVGGDGASTPVSGTLPVSDGGGALTVDGAVTVTNATAANLKVEATIASAQTLGTVSTITNVVHVDDNAGSLTVDGAVTANAGTNLNTSALALESGGNLAAIKAKTDNIPAQGQALAAASLPVVLTAAQVTTLTPPAAITGFLTESDFDSKAGALTETAPATDTASSGLNGRLQRIAQRITSLIALLPSALTGSGNLKAAIVESTATVTVSGTVTASGPLTDTQLRATAVPVSLASVPSHAVTGPLTDTELRATAVPVSLASVPSHAVTNAGTFAVQATEADGANVTLGAKTDAKSTATDATSVSAMQVLKQISASVQAPPSQAVTNAGTFPVQATLAAETTKVIGTVNIASGQSLAANQSTNIAQINGVTPLMGAGNTGTGSPRVTIASDQASIPVAATLAAETTKVIGTINIAGSQTLATLTTLTTLTGGGVAHDAADSGNPIKVGARAISAEITAVSAGDRVDALCDLAGKRIVLPYANPENFVSGAITSAMTGTTSTSLIAAPAAGLRNYITTIVVSNAHATVNTDVVIQDGSGGTTLMTIPAACLYGGAVINLPVPLRQPTTATAIYCACVTTGSSTKVSAVGYKGV